MFLFRMRSASDYARRPWLNVFATLNKRTPVDEIVDESFNPVDSVELIELIDPVDDLADESFNLVELVNQNPVHVEPVEPVEPVDVEPVEAVKSTKAKGKRKPKRK